ncbi:MAG: T9SS type A sorting domain-containing protein [Bacteroidales bacterium]|nr:T9SS type A sorting domain-containing protein [Bacteroidales bacterium]
MKKPILLIIVVALFGFAGFCTTVTVTNSGTSFSPGTITINPGDDVNFNITDSHNAVEVSQATYNANGTTPLSGGFSVPFGGGTVPVDKLTAGIHYYVCTPHAGFGMKGTITVLDLTGVAENTAKSGISIYPNPSNGNFQLKLDNSLSTKKYELGIYTLKGEKVYAQSDIQQKNLTDIEISDLPKGVYIVRLYGRKENYYKKIVIQ